MFKILSRSSGNVIGIRAEGLLTHADYQQVLPELEKMIKAGCKFIEIDTVPFARAAVPIAEKFEADGMWEKGLFKKITETY